MQPVTPRRRRLLVEAARKMSPLPWWATEPTRPSPSPTRRATRSSWRASSGMSVSTMPMHDPPSSSVGATSRSATSVSPTGTPPMRSRRDPPKLHSSSTPIVPSPSSTRDAVPIPPLWPIVDHAGAGADDTLGDRPVGGGVERLADVIDASASDGVMSSSHESSHSPTTGTTTSFDALRERGVDESVVAATDVVGRHQHHRRLEDAPLADLDRPGELARAVEHGGPRCHRIGSTSPTLSSGANDGEPVRATDPSGSSRHTVTWPTRTPGTSVIALCSPVGAVPKVRPKSRARGRGAGGGHRASVAGRSAVES